MGVSSRPALRSADLNRLALPIDRRDCPDVSVRPSFDHAAPDVWNSLSERTKAAGTVENFRKLLKTELFQA